MNNFNYQDRINDTTKKASGNFTTPSSLQTPKALEGSSDYKFPAPNKGEGGFDYQFPSPKK